MEDMNEDSGYAQVENLKQKLIKDLTKTLSVRWYHSGDGLLAALFWLSFVATVFLVMLGIVPSNGTSAGAIFLFILLASAVSFSISGSKK